MSEWVSVGLHFIWNKWFLKSRVVQIAKSKFGKSTGSSPISYKWVGKSQGILDEHCHCETSSQSSLPPTISSKQGIIKIWQWIIQFAGLLPLLQTNDHKARLIATRSSPTPISYNPSSVSPLLVFSFSLGREYLPFLATRPGWKCLEGEEEGISPQ